MVTVQSFKPAYLDGTPVSKTQMQALEQAALLNRQNAQLSQIHIKAA